MTAIRSTNTKPEMAVRQIVYRLGYRYRLHAKDLPGSPDIVLRRLRCVIFVHGCFWHTHSCADGRGPEVTARLLGAQACYKSGSGQATATGTASRGLEGVGGVGVRDVAKQDVSS